MLFSFDKIGIFGIAGVDEDTATELALEVEAEDVEAWMDGDEKKGYLVGKHIIPLFKILHEKVVLVLMVTATV